jgi:DNA/RNA endonuclease YhcR with UshA esterase domain
MKSKSSKKFNVKKIGVGVDYSNICKDYNTMYLDRDNLDPATAKCMKQVLAWTKNFLTELLDHFGYKIYNLSSEVPVSIEDIAAKRFLFYSLEKEITLQSYVISDKYIQYPMLSSWEAADNNSILIQNDEDGGAVYFYYKEGSKEQEWILSQLKDFTFDEIPFEH